jgi:hypothetical protein
MSQALFDFRERNHVRHGIRRLLTIPTIAALVALTLLSTVKFASANTAPCNKKFAAQIRAGVGNKKATFNLKKCLGAIPGGASSDSALTKFDDSPEAVKPPKFSNPAAGDVLVIGGLSSKTTATEFFHPATRKFVKTGITGGPAAFTPIEFAEAGQILIAGGLSMAVPTTGVLSAAEQKLYLQSNALTTARVYDFATGTLTATTGGLNTGRAFYTATLIAGCGCAADGQVLIAGGFDTTGAPLKTAELYDPTTQTFTAIANPMTDARAMHTATLLSNGTVLIIGGIDRVAEVVEPFGLGASAVAVNTAEIFDPSAKTFTAVASKMPLGAAGQTATVLQNGKVLIAGGFEITPDPLAPLGSSINQAELYDPASQTFIGTGSLTDDRVLHTATLLPNGSVLITGGATVTVSWTIDVPTDVASIVFAAGSFARNTAEIYDPNAGTFTCIKGAKNSACVASMAQSRAGQSATLLTAAPLAGNVLIAGGWGKLGIQATAELFNPAATKTSANGSFKATGSLSTPHTLHGALLLQ